jgi:hypothetical protein
VNDVPLDLAAVVVAGNAAVPAPMESVAESVIMTHDGSILAKVYIDYELSSSDSDDSDLEYDVDLMEAVDFEATVSSTKLHETLISVDNAMEVVPLAELQPEPVLPERPCQSCSVMRSEKSGMFMVLTCDTCQLSCHTRFDCALQTVSPNQRKRTEVWRCVTCRDLWKAIAKSSAREHGRK